MPKIPAELTQNNPADTYALVDGKLVRGTTMPVADLTARDAILADSRKEGMDVYVIANTSTYKLVGGIDNTDWVIQPTTGFSGNPSDLNQEGAKIGEAIIWDNNTEEYAPTPVLANTTGTISGGAVTVNGGDSAKFDVSAGSGWIISWVDPLNPTKTHLTWPQFLAVTVPNIATEIFTTISIQESASPGIGELVLGNVLMTPQDRRSLIELQSVVHTDFTTINSIGSSSKPSYEIIEALLDYIDALGPINEGNQFTENGANLSVDKSAGVTTFPFINRQSNPQSPTEKTNTSISLAAFTRYYQDGVGGFTLMTGQTLIDPEQWDDGSGTLAAVQNNKFQVKRIYFFGQTDTIATTYGQAEYSSLSEAKENIFLENPTVNPVFQRGTLVTALVVKKGVTNLTTAIAGGEAEFVPITSASVGGAGSVLDLQEVLNNGSTAELLNIITRITNSAVSASGTSSYVEMQTFAASLYGIVDRSVGLGGDFSVVEANGTNASMSSFDTSNNSSIRVRPDSVELSADGVPARYPVAAEPSYTYANPSDIISKRYADGLKAVKTAAYNIATSDFRKQPSELVVGNNTVTLTLPAITPVDGTRLEINLYNSGGSISLVFSAVTVIDSKATVLVSPLTVQAVVLIYDSALDVFKMIGKFS